MADNLADVFLKFTDADPEIPGESTDDLYPDEDGWLGIQSFSFGFGWGGSATSEGELAGLRRKIAVEEDPAKRAEYARQAEVLEKKLAADKTAQSGKKDGKAGAKEDSNQLKPKEFRFSRSPGPASKALLANLLKGPGREELGAQLIVCRPAGTDIPNGAREGVKIPFLKFFFWRIQLTKCSLSISKDQPPSEDIEFSFEKVQMETMWTDNETGEKLPGGKNTIFFNFGDKDSNPEFEGSLDTDD
jgi:hypothetical protein